MAKDKTFTVSFLALRVVMLMAGLPALVYGAGSAIHPEFMAQVARTLSSAKGTLTPDMAYLAKPLGLYVGMYGGLLVFAATDPGKYRIVIIWSAILLGLRALQRLSMTGELFNLYQISFLTNMAHVVYLACLATALYVLRPPKAAGVKSPSSPISNDLTDIKEHKVLIRAHLD